MTLDDLIAARAAIPDDDSLPASTTRAELANIQRQRALLDRRIHHARDAASTLAALPSDAADQHWLDQLNGWRQVLCDQLLALPSRIRDAHTLGVQTNLTISIRAIDFGPAYALKDAAYSLTTLRLGALMKDSGYTVVGADPGRNYAGELPWHGSIKEVEQRITDRARRRATAQAQLDDALLDDDERAKRDASSDMRRARLNAEPQLKTRGDGSQYLKYPDGRRVEVAS